MSEVLDLVDSNDNVVDSMERGEVYRQGLHNFRLVYALITNNQDKLWIPRRTASKEICPLHLDASMGGHVSSGETYEEAFARELEEELGLVAEDELVTKIGKLSPFTDGSYAFAEVYRISRDEAPAFNTDDFVEAMWLSPEEILERQESGDKVKSDLVIVTRALITGRL
jgi:isopentenyl-diphosphate delta-isomerase